MRAYPGVYFRYIIYPEHNFDGSLNFNRENLKGEVEAGILAGQYAATH